MSALMMRHERLRPETSDLTVAEARASVSGLDMPLEQFIEKVTRVLLDKLGLEKPSDVVEQLGSRWQGARDASSRRRQFTGEGNSDRCIFSQGRDAS